MPAALAGDGTGAGIGLQFYELDSGSGKAVFAAGLADFRCTTVWPILGRRRSYSEDRPAFSMVVVATLSPSSS